MRKWCVAVIALVIAVAGLGAETKLDLTVSPGANWMSVMRVGLFPSKKAPQVAAWVEDESGAYVTTLTVTAKAGKGKWLGAPKDGRPEALPVWAAATRRGSAGAAVAARAVDVDGTTSATPSAGLQAARSAPTLVDGKRYRVRLEVNASFDYNDAWKKDAKAGESGYSGVNGQPSVIYEATFVAGESARVELTPVGTGSVDGSKGEVKPGLAGLTTALTIVGAAVLKVN
jgi:hypothetical protein